jgi:hypothetical protein
MNQVILHCSEKYITENLEFYFSGERDKYNQIRPDKSIKSMTPVDDHLICDFSDAKVCNFFYPQLPNQLDRIYIGISVSLFANHWGASFLIELLKLVKPGGVIILPVYPEGQAGEKGYWSRSFLENIFLSRSRWRGMSNVNAENDGVMSVRIGKKWPESRPSSIEWFYQERSNLLLSSIQSNCNDRPIENHIKNTFSYLCELIWQEYNTGAIIEKIIQDNFNVKQRLSVINITHDYGLLINDLMLSPQLNLEHGISCHIGSAIPSIMENSSNYFAPLTEGRHQVYQSQTYDDLFVESLDVIIMHDLISGTGIAAYEQLVKEAWSHLNTNGLLVLFDDLLNAHRVLEIMDKILSRVGDITYYSAIVTTKIEFDMAISQYSLAIEEEPHQEAKNKNRVYRVSQKTN